MQRPFLSLLGLVLLWGLTGCTTSTGERTALNPGALDELSALHVSVEDEPVFASRYHRDTSEGSISAATVFGGAIGYAVASGSADNRDDDLEEQFRQASFPIDLSSALEAALIEAASKGERFSSVTGGQAEELGDESGLLKLTVLSWGIKRCPGSSSEAVLFMDLDVQLSNAGGNDLLWHSVLLFTSEECSNTGSLLADESLFVDELNRMIGKAAFRIANQIKYAR